MKMSINVINIIDRIKRIKGLRTDASVADCLWISRANFAVYKLKGRIPYRYIVSFCEREKISANLIFWGREPKTIDGELLGKAAEIMASNTIYKDALRNSIEALYKALCERRNSPTKIGVRATDVRQL